MLNTSFKAEPTSVNFDPLLAALLASIHTPSTPISSMGSLDTLPGEVLLLVFDQLSLLER